jgi:hypothetical protein
MSFEPIKFERSNANLIRLLLEMSETLCIGFEFHLLWARYVREFDVYYLLQATLSHSQGLAFGNQGLVELSSVNQEP